MSEALDLLRKELKRAQEKAERAREYEQESREETAKYAQDAIDAERLTADLRSAIEVLEADVAPRCELDSLCILTLNHPGDCQDDL